MSTIKVKHVEDAVIDELSKRRRELNYTYEKLAELTGLHRTSLSLIERKKTHPTLQVCLKISEALEIKLSDLIKKAGC